MDIDWSERMSWGDHPTTRTTSPFFSTKEVAKHGRCVASALAQRRVLTLTCATYNTHM